MPGLRPCPERGCPVLVATGRCAEHAKERTVRRGTRQERGYGTDWERLRRWFKTQPQSALCRPCKAKGLIRAAGRDVDHIIPFDGLDDPLRLDPDNLQGICDDCHKAKTAAHANTMKAIVNG